MTTLGALYTKTKQTLKQGGTPTPELDARRLIAHALNISEDDIFFRPDSPITTHDLDALITKRLGGMPISKIIGIREFYGLDFIVNEHVLDPRPDTEILVEAALKDLKNRAGDLHILDVCTGSGCIAITLLKHLPNARATATDISPQALKIAQQNAQKHGVESRIEFIETSYLEGITSRYDALLSNPPYIRTDVIATLESDVKNHDPILALDGGKDGLNPYRIIFPQIRAHLKSQARAYFEMGFDQAQTLSQMAADYGLEMHELLHDYATNPRVIIVS